MKIVGLISAPSQTITAQLSDQPCRIIVSQKSSGLYFDLYVNDVLLTGSALCENANRLVRRAYTDFIGDFAFYDMQGVDNPVWSGLGSRWLLVYLEAGDL